ncbi:MAG: RNA polymerase factor sigma-54 [Bacteroidota bacterium]
MQHQKLGLGQHLKFSPQQIQLMKLLQVPAANLEQRIKEELENNPALEESVADDELENNNNEAELIQEPENEGAGGEEKTDDEPVPEEIKPEEELDMSEYYDEDDEGVAEYKISDPSSFYDPDDEKKTIPVAVASTFREYLESQMMETGLEGRHSQLALFLIGSLDDDGYLRRSLDEIVDDLSFRQNLFTDEQELLFVLGKLQMLDPAGVGARSLQECLLLQLRRKENPCIHTEIAIRILENHFDLFAKKHYTKLEEIFDINSTKLKNVLSEITRLNPKPGGTFYTSETAMSVIPDFILTNDNGELTISLTAANAPELRISNHFKEMVSTYKKSSVKSKDQKEAILFLKQKIDSAKWFIDAIQSRYHTMLKVMNCILNIQYPYLSTGDEMQLKPMVLKDIAAHTGLDISTVSRVTNSKYVQTEYGTISLKFFFSEKLSTDTGEEVSTKEVKKILTDLINTEEKSNPISDQRLTEIMNQLGYNVARRTVAKYREQLNTPVARLRKVLQ